MTNNKPLPEGWKWAKISDVATAQSGTGFPKNLQGCVNGDYPFAKVSDISEAVKANSGYLKKANNYLSVADAKKIGAKVYPQGTTLFAKIGEAVRLNRRVLCTRDFLADNNVMGLIPNIQKVIPKFLFLYTHTIDLYEYSQATTVPSVRTTDIQQISIPLPPLDEQERIVEKIETLFSQLDAGVAALKRAQAGLKRYRASVLKAAFEGHLAPQDPSDEPAEILMASVLGKSVKLDQILSKDNHQIGLPQGWMYGKLENLIYIAGRIGWRGLKAEEYTQDGPLFLSVYNLNYGEKVSFDKVFHISQERYDESPEIKIQENDILLVKDGAGIGKIGIVKNLSEPATVNSSLLLIRSSELFYPEFLFYLLKGPKMQDIVRARITGSATPHLFQRDIKQFTLLIPPYNEQIRIVAEIQRLLSVVDELEQTIVSNLLRATRMRQAILKRAFEGKL